MSELVQVRTGTDIVHNVNAAGGVLFLPGVIECLRRVVSPKVFPAANATWFFIVSDEWFGESRVYRVFRYHETGDPAEPIRASCPTWAFRVRRQAVRYASLLAQGNSEPVAEWLARTGKRNTEANRTWAALSTLDRHPRAAD